MALEPEQIVELYQLITAEIRFLTAEEGGRRTSIDLTLGAKYRPHFVVQDRNVRQAKLGSDNWSIDEPYVSMTFIDGPKNYQNGELGIFKFYCPFWTHPEHPSLVAGTEFTIREGGKIVAGGTVIDKSEPIPERTA